MRSPRDLRSDDLVLSHFTLGRDHPIDDRITAASAAGFAGLGFFAGQFPTLAAQGYSIGRFRDDLDAASLCLAEVEALSGWADATPSDSYLEFEALVWHLVDAFESRYVQAIGPYHGTIDDAARAFGALCDRAAEHGAVVGLEFLPFTNLTHADDVRRIVEQAGRPNGGACVDIWHHARGAADLDMIRAIPSDLITGIQMSDGPLVAQLDDYKQDCLRNRVPPGEGEFDAVGFVRLLLDSGVDVPWSLEVCNDDVWGEPAGDHVQRCADGMRRVLTAAHA
ncbi:MAG: sugar phosphate isomerase/epimerase family protein [Ilumatobacter sp.]|uniref:sugar phosphate isomerase/epimerase family protein n=1 Tax=Ilumatobacter sp. TaxID=1967498 RepID=UPI00391B1FFF